MKVLWCGDVGCSSGFAMCTDAVCDHLHEIGHEVHVLGLNWHGRPDIQAQYPYHLWPCWDMTDGGKDGFGVTRLPVLVERLRPDVIVILNDPWNIPTYLDYFDQWNEGREGAGVEPVKLPPVIAWVAVDAKNQRGEPLNRLDRVAVWTEFAAKELKRGGYMGEPDIIPLGADTEVFQRKDKEESRKRLFGEVLPENAFLVGAVGRNQPRKRLDLTLAYFSRWIHENDIDDAYLYLHVGPTGDKGVDLRSLIHWYGLGAEGRFGSRVILGRPPLGQGFPKGDMAHVYSALDVYLTTTSGEGFGLPALEAMACEVPVIAPDWSGLGCWAKGVAHLVPCTSTAMNAPLNSQAYTIGGVVDERECIIALDESYHASALDRDCVAGQGRRLAESLTWQSTAEKFAHMLHDVAGEGPPMDVSVYAPVDGIKNESGHVLFQRVEIANQSNKLLRARIFLRGDGARSHAVRYSSMGGTMGSGAVYLGPKSSHMGNLEFGTFPGSGDCEIVLVSDDDFEVAACPVSVS